MHPARGINGDSLRWADVAIGSGRTMHRLAQFHAINRPNFSVSESAVEPPEPGNLPLDLLKSLCTVLRQHTKTPNSCWFCLWEGYGWLRDSCVSGEFKPAGGFAATSTQTDPTDSDCVSPVLRDAVHKGLRLHLPHRGYLLLEGPVKCATEIGWKMPGGDFVPQSPNLFWPHDHAWCVASEIDLYCTLVAGSHAVAESLIADPHFEAWRVFADDPVTADSDDKNV